MRLFWTLLFLAVPAFGVGLLALSAFSPGGWLPHNISTGGEGIDWIFYLVLGVTGVVFVGTELLLAYAMWSARGRADGHIGARTYTHGNRLMEVTWTLATLAALLVIAVVQVPIWAKAKYYQNRPRGKTPDVLVEGSQFVWQVRYPAWDKRAVQQGGQKPFTLNSFRPDLSASFELVNELHIPAGEPVLVHLRAKDVIHSFWAPALRVKQDALPGHLVPVWFEIDPAKLSEECRVRTTVAGPDGKPGGVLDGIMVGGRAFKDVYQYEWVCAELCGWGHYRMRAKLYVHPTRKQYDEWIKVASAERLAPSSPVVYVPAPSVITATR